MWYFKRIRSSSLKKNDEIVESLSDRIEGRISLQDVFDPTSDDELLVGAGESITIKLLMRFKLLE